MHTPGRWEADKHVRAPNGGTFILAGSLDARVMRDPPSGCAVVVATVKHAEDVALIEAAPVLLALLCRARDELADLNQSENDGGAFLAEIDEAIDKAGGRQS